MTPLSDKEQADIAECFVALRDAISVDGASADKAFASFAAVYRGQLNPYIGGYSTSTDRAAWVGQLAVYLEDELGQGFAS